MASNTAFATKRGYVWSNNRSFLDHKQALGIYLAFEQLFSVQLAVTNKSGASTWPNSGASNGI